MTILIVARDAAATIARAIGSALAERDARVLLVDDHSSDNTAAIARAAGNSRLTIIPANDPGGVAQARQTALDAVTTPLAAWLDADDEWVPGRLARLRVMLENGADVAVESIDLHDGATGAWLRRLTVPAFLRRPGAMVRLFERNVLPGDTQIGFRVSTFREAGGYQPEICGPESFDLLLRAIRRGARVAIGDEPGYRMYAYPNSVSRHIDRQTAATAAVLKRHAYEDVRAMYLAAGYGPSVASWALMSMALFRREPARALGFLVEISSSESANTSGGVLEPDGPWPVPECWRRAFHHGTILLLQDGNVREAEHDLRHAEELSPTAEAANNLGVALARLGRRAEAADQFALALDRREGYYDASTNAVAALPSRITTHPLRQGHRGDYVVGRSLAG